MAKKKVKSKSKAQPEPAETTPSKASKRTKVAASGPVEILSQSSGNDYESRKMFGVQWKTIGMQLVLDGDETIEKRLNGLMSEIRIYENTPASKKDKRKGIDIE